MNDLPAPTHADSPHPRGGPLRATAVTPGPRVAPRPGWTGGRIAAALMGALLCLLALIVLGAGGTVLWADRTQRDAGYLTSDTHRFTAAGSALVTEPTHLGATGTGWLYAPSVLDKIRIRAEAVRHAPALFVGVGPTAAVERYLGDVKRTHISDFWTHDTLALGGRTPASAPGAQDFWVATSIGRGPRSLTWKPTDGSWTVVVMNADGRPGIDARADLGASAPALPWLAAGLLAAGAVLGIGGALLLVAACRRARSS